MSVYLDHAATSFPGPAVVCRRMNEVMRQIVANLGRCDHGGWRCTPQAHRTIGTFLLGTVRAIVRNLNIPEDVQALVQAIQKVTRMQDSL